MFMVRRHFGPRSPRSKLIENAVYTLLHGQFVGAPDLRGRAWKILEGSGMGLPHSASVSNLALFKRAEFGFAELAHVREAHGIRGFCCRYMDDVLACATDKSGTPAFACEYRTRAGYYKVLCESVSREASIHW